MLGEGKEVYVNGKHGKWIIVAAWELDSFQKEKVKAAYGYEVHNDSGQIHVVYNTDVTEVP